MSKGKTTLISGLKHILCAAALTMTAMGAASAETVVIRDATVHTMGSAGILESADVLIENGRISAVGTDLTAPEGAREIDASGKIVTPGLMTSYSNLGLIEVGAVSETRDDRSDEDAPFSAAIDVTPALNPDSTLFPITRIEGVTRAISAPVPSASLFGGQAAFIHLGEGDAPVVKPGVAMVAAYGLAGRGLAGGSRTQAFRMLSEALDQAKAMKPSMIPFTGGGKVAGPVLTPQDLKALLPVALGQVPLALYVNRASDILAALDLAKDKGLKLILLRAAEGWKVADRIAEAGVPVVLQPYDNLPSRFDNLTARQDNAKLLHEAGVEIAFSYFDTHNERLTPQAAGNAVAHGLPHEVALAAMTSTAAKIWGLDGSYGTLEAGKDADVVVWDGDPLEVTSSPDALFIRGEAVDLTSRQTELRDRYIDLQRGDKPFQYR